MKSPRPTIALTTGDPGGIGPEVIVKALSDRGLRTQAHFRIYGPVAALDAAATAAGIDPYWWRVNHASPVVSTTTAHDVVILDYPAGESFSHQATKAGGELSFRIIEDAILDARRERTHERHVGAIVTGPISKLAWQMAGHAQYPGHTELLATRAGAKRHAMMFVSPRLRVILVTTHVPLMEIRDDLTIGKVFDAIDLGNDACKRLGIARPRIGVCGLNPHAGEGGLLGDEESRIIEPAIRAAANEHGINVRGPFPGDTIFNAAVQGQYDLIVAMYHDQGLIPVKLLDRDRAVNLTVGLPIIRTSPDHGTAFDIAGQNKADPGSMTAAIVLAREVCGRSN